MITLALAKGRILEEATPLLQRADIVPLEGSEAYERLIPDARLLHLPGVGHYPHLERPDVFFPAVDAFLR